MFTIFTILAGFSLLGSLVGFLLLGRRIYINFQNRRILSLNPPSNPPVSIIIPILSITEKDVENLFSVFANLYSGEVEIIVLVKESDLPVLSLIKKLSMKVRGRQPEIVTLTPPPHIVDRTYLILEGINRAKSNLIAVLDELAIPDSKHLSEIIEVLTRSLVPSSYFLPSLNASYLKSIVHDFSVFSPSILNGFSLKNMSNPAFSLFKKDIAQKFLDKEPMNCAFNFETELIARLKQDFPSIQMPRPVPFLHIGSFINLLIRRFINSKSSAFMSSLLSIAFPCAILSLLLAPTGFSMLFSVFFVLPVFLISRFLLHLVCMRGSTIREYSYLGFFITIVLEPAFDILFLLLLLIMRKKIFVQIASERYELHWNNIAFKRGGEEEV